MLTKDPAQYAANILGLMARLRTMAHEAELSQQCDTGEMWCLLHDIHEAVTGQPTPSVAAWERGQPS